MLVLHVCYCLQVFFFFPGQILYDANNKVIGIGTNDMGIAKDGSKKENFQRGVEIKGFHFTCFFLSDTYLWDLFHFSEQNGFPI